jgi:hypothetical protein
VEESYAGLAFGPTIIVNTPGYMGGLTWSIDSVTPVDVGCVIPPLTSTGGAAGRLMTGATPLDFTPCQNGFSVVFRVARSNNAALFATCRANVEITQVAKAPIVTDCGPRAINERSITGTTAGAPLVATNLNVGTSILWFINTTLANNAPFTIGMCDGIIRASHVGPGAAVLPSADRAQRR